jgi:hypothetical protein
MLVKLKQNSKEQAEVKGKNPIVMIKIDAICNSSLKNHPKIRKQVKL